MKKNNKNILKRALASVLALIMCLSMTQITTFAAEGDPAAEGDRDPDPINDYVYVFISYNEGFDVREADNAGKPEFKASEEEAALNAANSAAEAEKENLDKAKEDLEKTAKQLGIDSKLTNLIENKPDITDVTKADGAVSAAQAVLDKSEVDDALKNLLEITRPEYGESSGTANITDVAGLNEAQAATDSTVSGEKQRAQEMANKINAAVEGITELQNDAEIKAGKAEAALQTYTNKQTELEESLKKAKDALPDPGTEPVRDKYQNYEEYLAQHAAWVKACETYNNKVSELQTQYDDALTELQSEYGTAYEAAETAKNKVQEACKALQDYMEQVKTNVLTPQDIAAYNEALAFYSKYVKYYNTAAENYNIAAGNYNAAVGDKEDPAEGTYNKAVNDYNDAVDNYNTAVDNYNAAVGDMKDPAEGTYNKAVKDYNAAVGDKEDPAEGTYNKAVNDYNDAVDNVDTAVGNYNDAVDAYNNLAGMWNAAEIAKNLEKLELDKIFVEFLENIDINGFNTSEMDNDQIKAYNAAIDAYNTAIEDYNLKLKDKMMDTMNGLFGGDPYRDPYNNNYWWTIGKIEIKGEGFFNPSEDMMRDYGLGLSYNNLNGDYLKGAVAVWEKNEENGTWRAHGKFTEDGAIEDAGKGVNENSIFGDENYVLNDKYKQYVPAGKNKPEETFAVDTAYRWVLKVDTSAAGYVSDKTAVWHLDGFVYVQKLNTLANLEEHYEKNDEYGKEEQINQRVMRMGINKVTNYDLKQKLDEANTYNRYSGVIVRNIKDWNEPNVTDPTTPEIEPIVVPTIEPGDPDPEPSTPPTTPPTTPPVTPPTTPPVTPPTTPVTPPTTPVTPPVTPPTTPVTPPTTPVTPPTTPETPPTTPETPPTTPTTPETPPVTPVVDVPDGEVPMVEGPLVEIDDEEVPLTVTPNGVLEDIFDEDVPLADVPQTGDISLLWYVLTIISGCALMVLYTRRKDEEEA